MTIDILWNSGIHQTLNDIEKIVEYGFDKPDERLMFMPYNKNIHWCSCAKSDVQSVTIITGDKGDSNEARVN